MRVVLIGVGQYTPKNYLGSKGNDFSLCGKQSVVLNRLFNKLLLNSAVVDINSLPYAAFGVLEILNNFLGE